MDQFFDRVWQFSAVIIGSLFSLFLYSKKKNDDQFNSLETRMNRYDIEKSVHSVNIDELKADIQEIKQILNEATKEIKDLLVAMAKKGRSVK